LAGKRLLRWGRAWREAESQVVHHRGLQDKTAYPYFLFTQVFLLAIDRVAFLVTIWNYFIRK
jgi:hypothetical protein